MFELCRLLERVAELHRERRRLVEEAKRLRTLMEKTLAFECDGSMAGRLVEIYHDSKDDCRIFVQPIMSEAWVKCTITISCAGKTAGEAMVWLVENAERVSHALREYVERLSRENEELGKRLKHFERLLMAVAALE